MKPILLGLLGAVSLAGAVAMAPEQGGAAGQAAGTAWDHEFRAIDEGRLALSQYRGKVLLVVNTASFCGFTHQYAGLQKLWEGYEARGLVVIGVPSNDFGDQEPKAEGEIKQFCEGAFGITFPLTAKVQVRGQNAHPFYKWVASVLGPSAAPRWNFTKILIGRDGVPVASYGSSVTPSSRELVGAIEHELHRS
ncbi:MAG: glutathione peroxidase [Hyphomicrobiaceae bacterium]|nr:glutathione peroxidase [Hyphomicrobiaceae bacterium]